MAMKCPSCGGHLVYNIELNQLDCPYCDSKINIEDYKEKNAANVTKDSETMMMNRFVCRNCGAELSSPDTPDEQIVHYCSYCGGESVMMEKAEEIQRPESIIPFKISKKAAKNKYKAELDKMYFVPKDFKNPDFLEEFRGIYIPYWRTKVQLKPDTVKFKSVEYSTEGKYDYTRHYEYHVQVDDKQIKSGDYDASLALDDSISRAIAPFREDDAVPFNEAYLAGFYADKASAPVENYEESIRDNAEETICNEVKLITDEANVSKSTIKSTINFDMVKPKTSLFPIWFLTWRKKDRVSYSVMNGDTGSLSAEIPVDYAALIKKTILAILLVFAVLSFVPFFIIPIRMSIYSSYLLFLSSLVIKNQMNKISLKENHVFDFGDAKINEKNRKKARGKKAMNGCFVSILVVLIIVLGIISFSASTPGHTLASYKIMLLLQTFVVIYATKDVLSLENKKALIPLFFCIFAQLMGIILSGPSKPQDYWYLTSSIICNVGMILNMIFSLSYINYMVTRPVPNFYKREGADNGNK